MYLVLVNAFSRLPLVRVHDIVPKPSHLHLDYIAHHLLHSYTHNLILCSYDRSDSLIIMDQVTPSISLHLNSILQSFKEKHIFLRW